MAVVLCDIEGFSYKEIADIMECPVGTVMSRLHRGRRLLQQSLREYAIAQGVLKDKQADTGAEPPESGESGDMIHLDDYRRSR